MEHNGFDCSDGQMAGRRYNDWVWASMSVYRVFKNAVYGWDQKKWYPTAASSMQVKACNVHWV